MDDEPLDLRIHNRGRGSISSSSSSISLSTPPITATTFSNQVQVICRARPLMRSPTIIPTNTKKFSYYSHSPPPPPFQSNVSHLHRSNPYKGQPSTFYSVPSSSTSSRSSADEDMELGHEDDEAEGSLVIVETIPPATQELDADIDVEEEDEDDEGLGSGSQDSSRIPSGNSIHEEDSSFVIQISMTQDGNGSPEQETSNSVLSRTGRSTSKHLPAMERLLKSSRLLCFLCDQKAKNGKTLETHILKCHSITTAHGKFLCCTHCGFKCTLLNSTELKEHFTEKHSEAMKGGMDCKKAYYPCSHCSRMYRKQSLLDAHMRLVNQKDNWKKIIST